MRRFSGLFGYPVIITLSIILMFTSYSLAEQVYEEESTDLVARITVIEGRLERFDSETNTWVITVPDAPVGIDDQIFSGTDTRVEILIPNNTMLRIGEETEVRLVTLTEKLTEIELSSGTARLFNNSLQTDISAATLFGHILVPPGASVDLYVDEKAVKITSLDDSVYFTSGISTARHEIIAGSASLVAYSDRIMPSTDSVDRSWDAWNRDRDTFWAERKRHSGESRDYLPMPLRDETYVLDTFGSWQQVYYEGAYYRFWRPLYVGVDWAPFTVGMWMNWRGDRVWLSREPFGYITHHYGNWIYTMDTWYWAPPVSRMMVRAGLPLLKISYCWYPGRVAWIDAGVQASWILLAPFEPYYCRYPWGPHTVVIGNGSYPHYAASYKFKYRGHAIMGRQDYFYRDRRGSHDSKWRTTSRSGVNSSLAPRNAERSETGNFRNTRERKNRDRIREDGKPEGNPIRGRLKHSEPKIEQDRESEEAEQMRSRYAPSWKTGNRKSTVGPENSAISTSPEERRRFDDQAVERRSNQLREQNRLQPSTGNTPQSGFQNRSGVTRTEKNMFQTDSPDRGEGQSRPPRSTDNIQRSGSINRSGVTRTEKNMFQTDSPDRGEGQSRPPRSTDNIQRSGSINRSDVTSTEGNEIRTRNNTNRSR